jgi:hypothetical protein
VRRKGRAPWARRAPRARRARRLRLLLAQVVAGTALAGAAILAGTGGARAAPSFSVINGTVNATSLHEIVGSNALPNFTSGALDNRYPLAQAHLDNSPATEAVASPADTGPFGQFLATSPASPPAGLPPGPAIRQPQYADSKFPPGSNGKPVTVGTPGTLFASAAADQDQATAQAAISGTVPQAGPLGAARASLLAGLLGWRNRWLSAADAHRLPLVAAASPDGTQADSATASAAFDSKVGQLVLTSEARTAQVSVAGGLIALKGLHLVLRMTHDGTTPKHTVTLEIATASVGGVPVTIGQNGVSISAQQVPGIVDANRAADDDLNAVLRQSGFQVFTVAPDVVRTANQETVDATGVHITWTQPNLGPGIPQQTVGQIVGEAFADALAQTGPTLEGGATAGSSGSTASPAVATGPSGATSTPGGLAETNPSGGGTAPAASGGGTAATGSLISVIRHRPGWLLAAYVLWQICVLGTAASLWWWRNEAPA